MAAANSQQTFRIPAAAARQRGLPALGIELKTPADVDVEPIAPPAGVVVRCRERRPDGRAIGELEVGVFAAALIIDRDGILETKARDAAITAAPPGARVETCEAIPLSLPGGSGYRVDAELRGGDGVLRYAYVVALASHDFGIDGGVLVVVRSATRDWAAADAILRSLRILTRHGTAKVANDSDELFGPDGLPLVDRR